MILYTHKQLNNLQKRFAKSITSAIFVAIFGIVLSVVLCFFVNDDNALVLQIVVSVINVLIGWYVIGCIFLSIVPLNRKINFTQSMLNGTKQTISGNISKIGETITFAKIAMVEVVIVEEKQHVCYWQSSDAIPFLVNDNVTLQVVNGRIYSYEVISHE